VVKRTWILLALLLLAGLAWASHEAAVAWHTRGVRQSVDQARRQLDFVAVHEHLLTYLTLHPTEAAAHVLAGQSARRADLLADFRGLGADFLEIAARHLDAAQRLGALPPTLDLERTLIRVQQGQLGDSESKLIERVKQGDPNAPFILEALVHGYLRNLQCEKALVCVEALLKLEPANALGLLRRGRIRAQTQQMRRARDDYELAVRFVPEFDAARYYLAETLLRCNQVPEAESHLQFLNTRVSENLLVRLAWARCRIAMGDVSLGRDLLDSWLADAPRDHPRLLEALTARANVALVQACPAEAEDFARRALRESPLDRYALHSLALSLNALGRRTEAVAIQEQLDRIKQDLRIVSHCRERLAQDPANLQLRHDIGAAYMRVGRPAEALVWLNSVLDREPNHLPTLQTLAAYHAQAGNPALAVEMRRRGAVYP
jgi:predicted Zn-dependent protease